MRNEKKAGVRLQRLSMARARTGLVFLVLFLFATYTGSAAAEAKRVFMAPDDHTDYFWSATAAQYQGFFIDTLDYYLDQADATKSEPPQFQSRFSADGSLWLREYEKNKTPGEFQRLVDALKSGHISAPLNPLVITYGGVPAEAVIRSMYYSGQLERKHNLDFPLAIAMENAGMPYGLGSVWSGAGADYSWKGVCACPSLVPDLGNRDAEIYNWVGPDGSSILMKWNSLHWGDNQNLGGYAEARFPDKALDIVTTNAASNGFAARYPYNTIGVFGQGWDDNFTKNLNIQQTCKAKTDSTRTCIVSDTVDFFDEFKPLYGGAIPSISASFGNEWDLSPASLAEVSARVKRALEKLRSAEALATLVALKNPAFLDGRDTARDRAFLDFGLFFEHDFENGGPGVSGVARIAWQRDVAAEIDAYADTLFADASSALGGMIRKSGTNQRFFVFNPLSSTRTDVADLPYAGALPVHVVDLATNAEVPSQVATVGGTQSIRVEARNIPSVGYKVFEVQPGIGQTFTGGPTANAATGVIENDIYRITVSPRGAITSFLDKRLSSREFAGAAGGLALNDLGAASGTLAIEDAGSVSVTLRAVSAAPLAHTTRITLVRGSDRVAIRNEITQNFGGTREWRFNVNVPNPDVHHEEVGAILRARLTTQGGEYSPTNARYDYLTLNHFADMTGSDGVGLTLSNADAYFVRIGNSTVSSLDTATPALSVVAGSSLRPANPIMNQAGDSYLLQRFALQSHGAYDQAAAMRFALEHQNPLVAGRVSGGTAYPEDSYSFLAISDPNVLLWSLKPAEEGIGEGVIARVWNLTPTPRSFSLTLNEPIAAATSVTHIETDRGAATVSAGALAATAAKNQLLSFRIFPASLPGTVKILPSDARLTEAGDTGSFTIVRRGDTSSALDVGYTVSGSATPGSDYEALPGTATLPAGATSTTVPLVPLPDSIQEPDERITVTLTAPPGYLLALWRSATASIVVTGGTSPPPPPPQTAAPVALYPLNEGTGGTTSDVSGNDNTGTIIAATWTAGKYGQGLQFNGSTAYVTVGDAASLDLGPAGTVEAWIRLDALNIWHGVVAKGTANSSSAHNYALEVTNGNRVECGIGNGATANTVSSTALTAGTLYHVACVWTGTQTQVYVNGALSGTGSQTITPSGNTGPLYIGQYGGNADRTRGLIDEVRIYGRALTQAEVQSDMNTPISPPAPDVVNPTVAITAPAAGATVAGTVSVTAGASDNVGVAGVQFKLDGANLGVEDVVAPYAINWDTVASANGSHLLSATARDAAGNRATATDVTVTAANDKTPPTVPTNVSAVPGSSSTIDVAWSASTDNVAVTGYRVTRNGNPVTTTTATTFKDTGLTAQTTYTYVVAAFDAANNASAPSTAVSATTPANSDVANPTVAISAPTGGATVSGTTPVTANASDDVGVAGVQFKLDGANLGPEDVLAPYSVNWDTVASANGTHVVSATARDAAGNSGAAPGVTVTAANDKTAPTVPTNVTAVANSSSTVDIAWSASTDNVAVTGYRVTRNGALVTTTTATTFQDTGLTAQTTYTYAVAAFDAANNVSSPSGPVSATTPPPSAGSGPVAAYRFAEGTGTVAGDASGNGNNGTLVNGTTWTIAGKYGGALDFDGVDDHVQIADAASLDLGRTGSIEAWVRLDRLSRRSTVLAKGNVNKDQSQNYALQATNSNRWECILGSGASAIVLRSSTAPRTNQFYHLACVWTGTAVQLYIDGVQNASVTQSITPAANSSPLYIGQFGGNADRFDGVVDEMRVYNRALTLAEVRSDMGTPLVLARRATALVASSPWTLDWIGSSETQRVLGPSRVYLPLWP